MRNRQENLFTEVLERKINTLIPEVKVFNIWKLMNLLAVGFAMFSFDHSTFAQNLTRSPYLQKGTPKSVVVRWRTDVATDSRVEIGSTPGTLTTVIDYTDSTTEHEVMVTGLAPYTRYYYSIGSSATALAGNDTTHFFVTSQEAGTSKPTRIWVLGDSGTKDDSARAVRDAYFSFTENSHTDLWLMLGDNAYRNGSDKEYQKAIFLNMYETMLRKSVLWPTLGNHDNNTSSTPGPYPYYDIFTLPTNGEAGGRASETEAYYSFDYGNIHFICLNSATSSLVESGSEMLTWLQGDVAINDKMWTIAFWHHPPYSKGSHDSDAENKLIKMRENVLPILESGGVDLVLTGHSHSYERSFLLNGHYGKSNTLSDAMKIDPGDGNPDGDGAYEKPVARPSPHKGTVYLVLGSSGDAQGGALDHPVTVSSFNLLGSVVLDIEDNILDTKFIDKVGNIRDYFRIVKTGSPKISLSPSSHDFGEIPLDSSETQIFMVENTGSSVLNITNVSLAGSDSLQFKFANVTVPFSLESGASQQIPVSFVPTSPGNKTATLRFESNDPNHNPADVILAGTAVLVQPRIAVIPEAHDYGEVMVDSSQIHTFVIKNIGGSVLQVTRFAFLGADSINFTITNINLPFVLATDDSQDIVINFLPKFEGSMSVKLLIENSDTMRNPFEVILQGRGIPELPVDVAEPRENILSDKILLQPNYPNPFNNGTRIGYYVPSFARVRVLIYNLLGQQIRIILDETQLLGNRYVDWDGRDEFGKQVQAGVYFYRLQTSKFSQTKKMLFLK